MKLPALPKKAPVILIALGSVLLLLILLKLLVNMGNLSFGTNSNPYYHELVVQGDTVMLDGKKTDKVELAVALGKLDQPSAHTYNLTDYRADAELFAELESLLVEAGVGYTVTCG